MLDGEKERGEEEGGRTEHIAQQRGTRRLKRVLGEGHGGAFAGSTVDEFGGRRRRRRKGGAQQGAGAEKGMKEEVDAGQTEEWWLRW